MPFTKFTSLESFGHVWRNQSRLMGGEKVAYRAKIKLHGTNAAIRCEGGEVHAQKRSSDITPGNDNAGFAAWLEPHKEAWAIPVSEALGPVIFYGEWAGPGVQKGDAVAQLAEKYFFIFAVQVGGRMVVDPDDILECLPDDGPAMDNVVVLPWTETDVVVDFSDEAKADFLIAMLGRAAEAIGERDPFIYGMFDIEGPGEGIVMIPVPSGGSTVSVDDYARYTFKVKAARHSVKKEKEPGRKITIPEGALAFVEMFVTEARCMQAMTEACDGIAEKARTPSFLKWLGGDIKKESEVELVEAGLDWKQVQPLIAKAAVQWFHALCDKPVRAAA